MRSLTAFLSVALMERSRMPIALGRPGAVFRRASQTSGSIALGACSAPVRVVRDRWACRTLPRRIRAICSSRRGSCRRRTALSNGPLAALVSGQAV